jgi:hypothetical protein
MATYNCNNNPIKFRAIFFANHLLFALLSTNLAYTFVPHQQPTSIQGGKQNELSKQKEGW